MLLKAVMQHPSVCLVYSYEAVAPDKDNGWEIAMTGR